MTKWQTKRLGDFVMFQRGFDLLAKDRTDGNIPVISSSGITGFHNQFKAKGEGVIIGRKGTLGTVHYSEQDYWPHDTTLWITDFKGNLPRFIYYFLPLLQLKKYDVGSSNPTLNRNYIHEIIATLPPLEEQQKIAAVLSALDAKIELNNRINAELENLAKTIYDYWFVQFDFPDRNGKPYKSSGGEMVYNKECDRAIPAGWEVISIESCCQIADCLHSKKSDFKFESENYFLLQLENIRDDGLIDLTKKYYVAKSEYERWISRIEVMEDDILITNAGRVAATAQIPKGLVSGIGRNITAIRPLSISPTYLFLSFRGVDLNRQIRLNTDSGAFFTSLNVKGIKKLLVVKPPDEIESKFEKSVYSIRRKRELNSSENQQLTQLRDWLLPMLMNGQISIK